MFLGIGAHRADSSRLATAIRPDIPHYLSATGPANGDDFVHAGAGLPDELLGHDLDTGSRSRGDGDGVPFFSATLGWLGVFLSGSDTSANALFGNLQVVTANALSINPVL